MTHEVIENKADSPVEYLAELEQRLTDLETEFLALKRQADRIGKEKRKVPAMWLWYMMMFILIVNTGLNLLQLILR